jgi:peptide-methionine (S)-S-oxide reductase
MFFTKQFRIPSAAEALPGRADAMPVPERHFVLNTPLQGPFPGKRQIQFGMGCFWGAEKQFWSLPGVYTTAVGYSGGHTPNPTYREVCSGQTGHTEAVLVVYDPARISLDALLKVFWESHDPTQGMRQGGDIGTRYRSAIHATDKFQLEQARRSQIADQAALDAAGHRSAITTEVAPAPAFYYAEEYHQQYLAKNPDGYCGIAGIGIACSAGLGISERAAG